MQFNMNPCWSRAVELVQGNFSLLTAIAAIFFLMPTVAIYLLIPDMQTLADPMADPEIVAERMQDMIGPVMGIILIATLVQFVGYGAMVALMGEDRPTVGQALSRGLKALPSLLAVLILFAIAYIVGAMLIMLPFSILTGVSGAPALGLIGVIPVLLFIVWLMARLSMSLPVMVLDGTLNPLKAVGESFKLTKPKQWPILLFWFVIFVIMSIIGFLFQGVFGLVAAMFGTGTVAMLVVGISSGAWSMVAGMLVSAIAVAMYAQLSGPSTATIEETFD